jgi:hypothetical protein
MKKSVRINFLVVTSVVAIFVFAGVWYLRPGVSNEMLDLAKQRQLQPLLEIAEPLRLSDPEASSGGQNVDMDELADQLLPTLRDDLAASLEDSLYGKLSLRLAEDPALLDGLADRLEPLLTENLASVSEEAAAGAVRSADIDGQLETLRESLLAGFEANLAALRSELTAQSQQQLSSLEARLPSDLDAYVPQLVDQLLPQVTEQVYRELADNREAYLPALEEALAPYVENPLDEEQLVALYGEYRDRIVADLVPSILDSLEADAAALVEQVSPVPAAPSAPVVSSSAVPAAPSVSTVTTQADDSSVTFVDPEVYDQERSTIRTDAIEEVLSLLNDGE